MAANYDVQVNINAKNNADAAVKAAEKSVGSLNERLTKMGPAFSGMAVAGTAAFAAVSGAIAVSIKEYANAERATRQLEQAVINISGGTRDQVNAVLELTNALEKKAGVDAESLQMGVAQLSTFGLQSESVVALTKSLADLTVNQNGANAGADAYIGSANIMAKAMRGEFGMLQKMGIRFTEHQQELIKTGTETQKVAALQEGLAQNLRETTDTISGIDKGMAMWARSLENVQVALAKAVLPALSQIGVAILPIVEKIAAWVEQNPKLAATIMGVVAAVGLLSAVVGTLGIALIGLTGAATTMGITLGVLLGWLALIPIAIAAIVAVVYLLITHWDEISAKTSEVWGAIVATVQGALESIGRFFSAAWEAIKAAMMGYIYFMVGLYAMLFDLILPGWQDKLALMVAFFAAAWEKVKAVFVAVADWFAEMWAYVVGAFDTAGAAIGAAMDAVIAKVKPILDWLQKVTSAAESAIKKLNEVVGSKVGGAVKSVIDKGKSVLGARALGGPVLAGQSYLVGENGPEIFTPDSYGRISNGGGQSIYVDASHSTFMGIQDFIRVVERSLVGRLGMSDKFAR